MNLRLKLSVKSALSIGALLVGSLAVILIITLRIKSKPAQIATVSPDPTPSTSSAIMRFIYTNNEGSLLVEILDDDLMHFELSIGKESPNVNQPIYTTPMVLKSDYPGPSRLSDNGKGTLETPDLKAVVDSTNLCVTLTDKNKDPSLLLTTICPVNLKNEIKGISLTPEQMQNVYGLGEEFFQHTKKPPLDWVGQVRKSTNEFGNAMLPYMSGMTGNAQFPVMFAVGPNRANYALFLDSLYKQIWDFASSPWNVQLQEKQVRWYVMTGPDLPDLRKDYMELVGRPPVPPKKMFGLWVSEFGFDNWQELEDKLKTLRASAFPIDGFVLDLQWFGGIFKPGDSQMGSLTWDISAFPDPAKKIASLRDEQGIGLMAIEESYINNQLSSYTALKEKGFLVKQCENCKPVYLDGWWGKGGMVDWTNPAAGDFWHDQKRQPLVEMGIIGHWTDLGEPEMYAAKSWYYGFPNLGLHSERDVHNLYNFRWSESIERGYTRNHVNQRPFILSRSGTAGIQRFGAAMWSGDIATNLESLAAHNNAQMHMSFSGMDYFGSDVGGFQRGNVGNQLNDIYTRWFANAALLDVPIRSHTENLCNCKETAPDRVGDLQSNLANLRLRYELSPYLYSLAHRANLYGEPVFPPPVFYFQDDPNVRQLGDEKMIGKDLLAAILTEASATRRDVYLPAGTWINFHTNEWFTSSGEWLRDIPLYLDGKLRLPLYARSGAIIPQMVVDEKTMNMLGKRTDGSFRNELVLSVFADGIPSSFTLYEDDGATIAYKNGAIRTTLINQQLADNQATITIQASSGDYTGAPTHRKTIVKLVVNGSQAKSVSLNGKDLPKYATLAEFEAAESGWYHANNYLTVAKSGEIDVNQGKTFIFSLADKK